MKLNDIQTKKLLEYTGQIKFKQLALNLALTRLKGMYKSNPSPATVSKCMAELNAMFEKFYMIMKDDYDCIVRL